MAAAQPFDFVLPQSPELVSGGNLYNAALLAALEERYSVRRASIGEFCQGVPEAGTYLLDSLNLAEIRALQLTRAPGRNLLLLVHHLPSLEPGLVEGDPGLAIEQATLPLFDAFVCTSAFTASHLRSRMWNKPFITLEPVMSPPELKAQPPTTPVRALMSCNLIRRKGVLEFLRELSAASVADDSYQIDIVGRHDLESSYGAQCVRVVREARALRERIRLPGEATRHEMTRRYGESNLFLSASRMETFGISLQEARFFGLPILAVAGGNSENHVSQGVTGWTCESPTDLARKFLEWTRDRPQLVGYQDRAWQMRPTECGDWGVSADRLVQQLAKWFPCP